MELTAIGLWGGMALLISSITGPGLTTIPLLFQEAGWLTPTLAFLVFGTISGLVSLFLVETMSIIQGNEAFQARVEYSTVAHLYLGKKFHVIMQVLLYCALQSVNISSIIISAQTMDSLLIRLFHKTCALTFTKGWICVSEINPAGSPFNSYVVFSFGYLISAAMVLPLSVRSLVQNIKFQLASVAILLFIMGSWVFIFANHGLDLKIPAVGSSQSSLLGFVLNNFAFITTIPSFINELSRHVSIRKTVAYPIMICIILYLMVGVLGAASFKIAKSSDLLATLSASNENKVLISIVNVLFPAAVLVTSVPVFAIVMRYNLVRGNFCSNRWAVVWAGLVPWILIIPFQTKGWLILVMNWTSLIFGSSTNFIIPLVLYISSKTYSASTVDASGGDIFVLHPEDSTAFANSRRRSTNIARISHETTPRFVITTAENDSTSTYNIPSSSLLTVYLPTVSRHGNFASDSSPVKGSEEGYMAEDSQQSSGSTLEPTSTPLRVIYSPSVSRSGSVGQSDRPSIVLTHEDGVGNDVQIVASEEDSAPRVSFQAPSSSEGTVYRRSRNNSNESNMDGRVPRSNTSSSFVQPSSSPTRRMAFEELGRREHVHEASVFIAFREQKWFRSIIVAKVMLAIVTCCVLGNLGYTIVESARGNIYGVG